MSIAFQDVRKTFTSYYDWTFIPPSMFVLVDEGESLAEFSAGIPLKAKRLRVQGRLVGQVLEIREV